MLHNILKIINNKSFLEQLQKVNEFEDFEIDTQNCDDYSSYKYASYIDLTEIGKIKAQELDAFFNLENMGSGCYRGVLRIGNNMCVKIALNNEGRNCNRQEYYLYKRMLKESPELTKMLVPIFAHCADFNVCPMVDTMEELPNYHIDSIIKLFEVNGIIIGDLESRPDNFGVYNGNIVISDYADWTTLGNKLISMSRYNIQNIRVNNGR